MLAQLHQATAGTNIPANGSVVFPCIGLAGEAIAAAAAAARGAPQARARSRSGSAHRRGTTSSPMPGDDRASATPRGFNHHLSRSEVRVLLQLCAQLQHWLSLIRSSDTLGCSGMRAR